MLTANISIYNEHVQKQDVSVTIDTGCINILPACLNVFITVCSTVCSTICLRDMLKYTAGVREWMSADPKNIIAIHCKGGKGDALTCFIII